MGRTVSLVWQHDPTIYAPAKYQRACGYEAFIPDTLTELSLQLDAQIAGVVSEAEAAIRDLNGPISVILAAARNRYIEGLTRFRQDRIGEWIEHFAAAAAAAAHLATSYLKAVEDLSTRWRTQLAASPNVPRADAAAWAVIEVLPAHPIITAPVAAAVTRRSKPSIYEALRELQAAGVLEQLSQGKRNQSWEAVGLLDLIAGLEAGQLPIRRSANSRQ